MRAGKHVLVEKPAGANIEGRLHSDALRRTACSASRCASPSMTGLERTRTLIDRGDLGKLVSMRVYIHHPEAVAQRAPA